MFSTKNFDMTFIFKNHDVMPKAITAIEIKALDAIQEWLSDVDITYTSGGMSINWVMVMKSVREDDRFYFDTDEDGERKPAGWLCLSADADDEEGSEESADEDSNFEVNFLKWFGLTITMTRLMKSRRRRTRIAAREMTTSQTLRTRCDSNFECLDLNVLG